jgi:hypothetical protein
LNFTLDIGDDDMVSSSVSVHSAAPAVKAGIEVFVLFTDIPSTLAALRTAAQLAHGLSARIRLLALHCVPYPLPLDKPSISVQFLGQRFRTLTESCTRSGSHPVETIADIRLCRDSWEALRSALAPGSVVVIGKRSGWWPKKEDGWARKLRDAGHHVVRTCSKKESAHA